MRRDIFPWLVEHHYNTLDEFIKRDNLLPIEKYDIKEGSDRNVHYHGFLFMVDGPKILDNLRNQGMINDNLETLTEDYHSSVPLEDNHNFLNYLKQQESEGDDGAYIFNSVNGKIVRVSELNNNPRLPEDFSLIKRIPHNFINYDHIGSLTETDSRKIGTKTRIAIKIPASMDNVHAYQVKRSPYGNKSTGIGMGKVTHFDKYGLDEEFFFKRNDGVVVGVYRYYPSKDYNETPKDLIISDLSRFEEIRTEAREYEQAA